MIEKLYKYLIITLITFLTIGFTLCQPISGDTLNILKNNYILLDDTQSNVYDLLIITPNEFEKALKPLQIHKENKDFSDVKRENTSSGGRGEREVDAEGFA